MDAKQRLDAQVERTRIAREEYLRKHPVKTKTLEEEFGPEAAARIRSGAKLAQLGDPTKEKSES